MPPVLSLQPMPLTPSFERRHRLRFRTRRSAGTVRPQEFCATQPAARRKHWICRIVEPRGKSQQSRRLPC
jgi:hypothetical protein